MISAGCGDCASNARSAEPTNFPWLKFGKTTEIAESVLIYSIDPYDERQPFDRPIRDIESADCSL